jgi:hypothetical protein
VRCFLQSNQSAASRLSPELQKERCVSFLGDFISNLCEYRANQKRRKVKFCGTEYQVWWEGKYAAIDRNRTALPVRMTSKQWRLVPYLSGGTPR